MIILLTRRKILIAVASMAIILCGCSSGESQRQSREVAPPATAPKTVTVSKVVSNTLSKEARLPADLVAFRDVAIFPKVPGFIEWIGVDRGSVVKKGDLLIHMTAPELPAQTKQSVDQAQAASDDAAQLKKELDVAKQQLEAAKAKLKGESDTYKRMKEASSYPGIIAGNDLEIAQQTAASDVATVASMEEKCKSLQLQCNAALDRQKAAKATAAATKSIEFYLRIVAPFDGVITERNVHEGSFVHPPAANADTPLLRLRQESVLRLVVPVPETEVGGIVPGAQVPFTVSAYPEGRFSGTVRRIGDAVDINTRTMPVEMDVSNADRRLAPGMFAEVIWPIRRKQPTLFVPRTAVVKTMERTFVIRVNTMLTEWVDVKPGFSTDDLIEVFGDLHAGDLVVATGTDELKAGTRVKPEEPQLRSTSR